MAKLRQLAELRKETPGQCLCLRYVWRNFAVMRTTAPDLLTVVQAADELCVSPRTLHHWIGAGKCEATKLGTGRTSAYVITRAELERVKAANRLRSVS